jgi:peptide/nickel transport system substrate-binding protein
MFRKSLYIAFALVCVMSFVLTACAGQAPAPTTAAETAEVVVPQVLKDTDTPEPMAEEEPTEAPVATEPMAEPTEAAAPAEEGEFVLNGVTLPFPRSQALIMDQVNYAMVESFNDWIPNGEDWAGGYVQIANEALWYVNYVTGEVVPWLAESMEYSADYMTWTVHLRKGVTWNDGEPFTANDIVYTLELLKGEPKLGGNPDILAFESVSAPDDFTMEVKLATPTPRYHELWWVRICTPALTQIVPKHIWENVDPLTFKNNPPVTTGAYKLNKYYVEQKIYVWERRDDYWNKEVKAGPKYVIYRSGPAADQILAEAKNNSTDVFGMDYKVYTEQHEAEIPHINVVAYLDPCPRGAFFNNAKPNLDKPEFRRAMSMLMNRPKWAENIWIPPTKPATALWADYRNMDQFINEEANTQWGTLQYDPEKALALLLEAGYKSEGGKLLDAAGQQVVIKVSAVGGPGANEYLFAQDFTEEIKKIGIDATLQGFADQPPFFAQIDNGDFDIGFWWFCGATVDPVELYAGYQCKDVVPIGELPKRGNAIRACDPEFDAVVDQLKAIQPEAPEANDLYMKAYDLWMKNAFGVPLVQTIYTQYYNTTYWDNMMSNDNLYTVPFNWWMQIQFLLYNITPKAQ